MLIEDREHIQDLLKQLMVLLADLNDIEKTFSRIRNEANELYEKLNAY